MKEYEMIQIAPNEFCFRLWEGDQCVFNGFANHMRAIKAMKMAEAEGYSARLISFGEF